MTAATFRCHAVASAHCDGRVMCQLQHGRWTTAAMIPLEFIDDNSEVRDAGDSGTISLDMAWAIGQGLAISDVAAAANDQEALRDVLRSLPPKDGAKPEPRIDEFLASSLSVGLALVHGEGPRVTMRVGEMAVIVLQSRDAYGLAKELVGMAAKAEARAAARIDETDTSESETVNGPWLVEVDPGCWLCAETGRTTAKASARRYTTYEHAKAALDEARSCSGRRFAYSMIYPVMA